MDGHAEPTDQVLDLVARWSSATWRAEATGWIRTALGALGIAVTGAIEQPRRRLWGTVLTVPTDAGLVWFKENHPAQSFEAALVERLGRITPDRVLPVLAVDRARGWLLTADQGPTLAQHDGDAAEHRVRVVGEFAALQRRLAGHRAELLATGVPVLDPGSAPARLAAHADTLAGLPPTHPFAAAGELAEMARSRVPLMTRAAEVLAASGIPLSVEHNDLHDNNAFVPGRDAPLRFFDFGDAVWGHPFASLFIPLSQALDGAAGDPRDDPHGQALVEAYLDPWSDLAARAELHRALDAALLLGHVHKLESWWRLARTTPADQLAPYRDVPEYLRADRFEVRHLDDRWA